MVKNTNKKTTKQPVSRAKSVTKKTSMPDQKAEALSVPQDNSAKELAKNSPMLLSFALLAIGLVAGFLLFSVYEKQLPAARVNNEVITKEALNTELMRQGGQKVLENKVTELLVLQEAKKKNIVISQKEIDAEYKKIEKQYTDLGQNFGELLKSKGITKAKFDEEIRVQLSIEKLIGKDVVVSDKELEDAVTANKERIAAEKDQEAAKAVLKEQIRQDKLQAKYQTWITELRNKAKVQLLVNY